MYGTQLWAFECLAQLFSMVANPILGLMLFMQVWFMAFLFTGVAVVRLPSHAIVPTSCPRRRHDRCLF